MTNEAFFRDVEMVLIATDAERLQLTAEQSST